MLICTLDRELVARISIEYFNLGQVTRDEPCPETITAHDIIPFPVPLMAAAIGNHDRCLRCHILEGAQVQAKVTRPRPANGAPPAQLAMLRPLWQGGAVLVNASLAGGLCDRRRS